MPEQPGLSFAVLLRQLRTGAQLTQEELAEAASVSPRSVSDLERGINRTARRDTALLLADALGLAGPARELFIAVARGRAPTAQMLAAARGTVAAGAPPGLPGGLTGGQGELAWLLGAVIDSPYRGLAAFEEQDAAFFFGREAATAQVLEQMARQLEGAGLLVVSGVSGAGKSSLLRAGVLPRIRAAGLAAAPGAASWPCLVFTPTRAPLDELALRVAMLAGTDASAVRRGLDTDPAGFALPARQAALARPPAPAAGPTGLAAGRDQPPPQPRLLLVVDQFEELFTQCPDEGQRRAFITALHAAATATHGPDQAPAALAVLGVRADFEARCADYPQLAGAVQDRYLVTAMTGRQLRMAITEPAKKADSGVDDDLAEALLAEVRGRQPGTSGAGMLPLLSHALDQAWRSRTGEAVTLADYEHTGGIEGAVASSAQRAYNRLTPTQQAAARQVFTRLTATSAEGVDYADRASKAELTDGKTATEAQDVETVLETFAAERLLTLAAGTVEISHEALLTAWPLLRDTWLAETHTDRIARTQLHTTATDWDRHSRDPSYLYTGTLLAAATGTAARIAADPTRHPPLSQTERDFLHTSDHAHRRTIHRRQGFTAFLMALVIGLASVAVLAVRASQEARQQRDIAVSDQLISQSESLGDTNPAISKLESIAAWRIHPSSQARYAMLAAAARAGIAVLAGHKGPVVSVAFSPDGETLASDSTDGTVRLWDAATGRQLGKPLSVSAGPGGPAAGNSAPFNSVAFSPDSKILAIGNTLGAVRLWDLSAGHQRKPLRCHNAAVFAVAFNPDGKTLAAATSKGVRLWEVTTGHQKKPLTSQRGPWSVAFSRDGKTLASGSEDGTVRLWRVSTGRLIWKHILGPGGFESVAFSPDGKTLASGNADGTVRLWQVSTGRQIGDPLTGHTGPVWSVAFSRDGKTLASGGDDGTVRLWQVSTGRQIGDPLTGHTGPVWSVAFSRDGKTLASGSADNTVRLWQVTAGRQVGEPLTRHPAAVNSVAFSPDGKTLASGGDDGVVRWWDVATGQEIRKPLTGRQIGDARPGRRFGNPRMGQTGVWSAAFSRDGKILASGSWDGTVRLWDVATGHQIRKLLDPGGAVIAVVFSADGKTLATCHDAGTVRLWDVATGRQIGNHASRNASPASSIVFSPDGKTLASGGADSTVRLWSVVTGRQIGKPLIGHPGEAALSDVGSVAFSPDGKTLASGGADGTIQLWDMATRRQIGSPFTGHTDAVNSVAFSRDGKTLASGSADGTVRLWDVATHRQIGSPFTDHTGASVAAVAFSPDGKTLASGTDDGTVRLWGVAYVMGSVPQLCASAGRSLTRAEWAQYVPPGPPYRRVCP